MRRFALFASLWLATGFVLGTATLIGPVTALTAYGREQGWPESRETLLVRAIIALLVVGSAAAALWLARVAGTPGTGRLAVAGLTTASVAGCLWLWMTPGLMGAGIGSESRVGSAFTFGPYPDADRLPRLREEGYTAVISLLHPAVVPFETRLIAEGREAVESAGMEFIHLPMLPWVSENGETLARLEALARSGEGRYYVHCYLGKDRIRIAQRVVAGSATDAVVEAEGSTATHAARRRLRDGVTFERGKVVEVAEGVFVSPYPTDPEFMGYVLGDEQVTVLSLLDPQSPEDLVWIEKERALLEGNRVPLESRPLSPTAFDPQRALEVAREAATLPRPLLVHAFLPLDSGRAPTVEAFVQAYRSDLPPLPPALFVEPLADGAARVLAPNIAVGPRPRKSEFNGALRSRGVRAVIYVGDAGATAAGEDRATCLDLGLAWSSADPADPALGQRLSSGGPWYLYGPGIAALETTVAALGPAIPPPPRREPVPGPKVDAPIAEADAPIAVATPRQVLPDARTVILLGPVFLLVSSAAAAFVGWLRLRRGVRTPYTRKIFHFVIFTLAGLVHLLVGFPGVALFGVVVSALVLHAVLRGPGFAFYEAMARPSDEPRRTLFILVPLLTTAVGGLLSTMLFGPFAFVGYLVVGWGDAVAEPVGTAWGRHRYRVPSLAGVPASRSLEGSAAVLICGGLAASVGLAASGIGLPAALGIGLACGLAGATLEAISNHGLDNLTVQLAASATAWMLLV